MIKPTFQSLAAAALAAVVAGASLPALAADFTIRATANSNENDEDYDGLVVFKNFVESASNGAVEVEIFMGTQLCSKGAECLQGVADGSIDVYISTSGGAPGIFPYVQVLDLPYLMSSARIAEAVPAGDFTPTLRALAYGGGRMPLPVIERAMRLFPPTASFTNAYGLTETSSTLSVLGPEEHRAALAGGDAMARQRLASVGRPLPGIEVQVRGPGGEVLPPGERGEIHVRGEQVSGEYLDGNSRLQADGWFPTRDGGYLDSAGYLFVEGRMDDIIVRGGENLSPGEIEAVLHEHEAVSDCAVVGVPDEEWGEAVAAVVALETGRSASARELQTHVRARLRSSRVPTSVHFVDELPYSETGKLLRRQIRDFLAAPPEAQPEPASTAPAAGEAAPTASAPAEAPEAAAASPPAPGRAARRRFRTLLGMALLAAALLAAWLAFSRF